jgi:hypothetical protein
MHYAWARCADKYVVSMYINVYQYIFSRHSRTAKFTPIRILAEKKYWLLLTQIRLPKAIVRSKFARDDA